MGRCTSLRPVPTFPERAFVSPALKLIARAALALAVSACAPETQRGPIVAVDDAGDTVRLARPARRVASLIPATTELLFAMGRGANVVGRTRWCDWPADAARVTDLGDGIAPNLEAITAVRPDLVVLYHSAQNAGAAERLRALGMPVVQLRSDLLADVPRIAGILGRLLGDSAAADSLARAFGAELAAATVPRPRDPRRIFILVWEQPPITVGRGSYLSEIIERAGAMNAYADLSASSGQISVESAVARDPDAVFTSSDTIPGFARRPEWRAVRAVREGRFIHASGSEFSRPGPRSPAAIRTLADRIAALR